MFDAEDLYIFGLLLCRQAVESTTADTFGRAASREVLSAIKRHDRDRVSAWFCSTFGTPLGPTETVYDAWLRVMALAAQKRRVRTAYRLADMTASNPEQYAGMIRRSLIFNETGSTASTSAASESVSPTETHGPDSRRPEGCVRS